MRRSVILLALLLGYFVVLPYVLSAIVPGIDLFQFGQETAIFFIFLFAGALLWPMKKKQEIQSEADAKS